MEKEEPLEFKDLQPQSVVDKLNHSDNQMVEVDDGVWVNKDNVVSIARVG
ncbi:hypothetical protein [Alicyclobacillus fodiniaquatilis]|jgi:hypothetical protein|uniref:Uncharacterized protein n=1 Tax=Alicyclobacillus fodiniaquatilis TaxID=1661150 RepID=A0ABW4JPE0_9BACL